MGPVKVPAAARPCCPSNSGSGAVDKGPAGAKDRRLSRRNTNPAPTMKTPLLALLLALSVLVLSTASCRSSAGGGPETTRVVYAATNLRASPGRGSTWEVVSTNFIEAPKLIPVGTRLELGPARRGRMAMTDESGTAYTLVFVERHHMMSLDAWLARQFQDTPVELPADLTDQERDAIAAGRAEVGISRQALFLAIGYPPATKSPNLEARDLTYQTAKFPTRRFEFDADNRVSSITP